MIVGRGRELEVLDQLVYAEGVGVVIRGDDGIGKSALAREFVGCLEGTFEVSHVVATRAAQAIPFGALAPLLPELPNEPVGSVQLLNIALAAARSRGGARRLVMSVDEVGLLDSASATMVEHLVRSGDAVLVATQTSRFPMPPWITGLEQLGLTRSIELAPLDRPAIDDLASIVIGGAVDGPTLDELWRLCEGNPLIAREIIATALQSGNLVERHGVSRITAPFTASNRLGDFLDARLAGLGPAERAVLETAAVGGVLPLALLESMGGIEAVEALEIDRLIEVSCDQHRVVARVARPLVSDRITQSMAVTGRRRIARQIASWTTTMGTRRHRDALQVALWQLDGGVEVQPDVAVSAATQALNDFEPQLAKRLCEAALGAGAGVEAQLTLGQSLLALGDVEAADRVLQEAQRQAGDDRDRARAATARCEVLVMGRRDIESAIEVVTAAANTISDTDWLDEVHGALARLALAVGSPDRALHIGVEIAARPTASPRAAAVGRMLCASAHVMMGRFADAESEARSGLTISDAGATLPPDARHRLMLALMESLAYSGRLDEATRIAEAGYREAEGSGNRTALGVWQAARGFVASWTGDIAASRDLYEQSIRALARRDPLGLLARIRARAALAAAQSGDLDEVQAHLADVDHGYVENRARTEVASKRAYAWSLALAGETEAAARATLKAALTAIDHGHTTIAAVALHDGVRFGHPDIVVSELTKPLLDFDGALLPICARHATALAEQDGAALEMVASDFDSIGANLIAAEAANQAAAVHRRHGDDRAAFRSQNRAQALLTRCPGANTPAIVQPHRLLTAREDQIARLAPHKSNREIAALLGISVRTVEAHVAAAYQKLGVHNRSELAAVFDFGS